MEWTHPSAIVALRAGSFRTEVLQDDAGVVDLSELSHYRREVCGRTLLSAAFDFGPWSFAVGLWSLVFGRSL